MRLLFLFFYKCRGKFTGVVIHQRAFLSNEGVEYVRYIFRIFPSVTYLFWYLLITFNYFNHFDRPLMGKFSISAGKKWRSQPIKMRKSSKKVRLVFFVSKFSQNKLSDFSRRDNSNLLPSNIPLCSC